MLGLLSNEKEFIDEHYKNYISNVSRPDMAISLELAYYLWVFLKNTGPRSVLELGSGFSSWVLDVGHYAYDILTMDTSAYWLKKTKDFLEYPKTSHLFRLYNSGDVYSNKDIYMCGPYDLVLNDISRPHRVSTGLLETIYQCLIPKGTMLIDDMHKDEFRVPLEEWVEAKGDLEIDSLRDVTLDCYGRYAYAVKHKKGDI